MVARNPFMAGIQAPGPLEYSDIYRAVQQYLHGVKDNEFKTLLVPNELEDATARTLPPPQPNKLWAWNDDGTAPMYIDPNDLYDYTVVADDINDVRGQFQDLNTKILDIEVSPMDFAAVGDGIADDTAAMVLALESGRPIRLNRNKKFKVASTLVAAEGAEIRFEPGAEVIGPGNVSMLSGVASGRVKIIGKGKVSNFGKLVDFTAGAVVDLVQINDVDFEGATNLTAATTGALISYFSSNVHIKLLDVNRCRVTNGRQGILFRGTWDTALVTQNVMRGIQHYTIRLGMDRDAVDWDTQGYALVAGNDIKNCRNPVTGGGSNECNGIAVFSKSANIYGNYLENVDGGGVDDIEGIYTKVQHGNIYGNILVDACRREGAICIKGAQPKPGTDYTQQNTINCYGNVIWFEKARSHEAAISIQSHGVNCYGNFIYTGEGVSSESAGIALKYRTPYRNVTIKDNVIYSPGSGYGILAWAYGENVVIKNNHIWGASSYGVRLESRDSSDVRYPASAPIGKNFVVEGNIIHSEAVGARPGIQRGISIAINGNSPIDGLTVRNNILTGAYSEYRIAITGSNSTNWRFEGNDISRATGTALLLGSLPVGFWVRNNPGLVTRTRGTDTVTSGTSTRTVSNPINSTLAGYLTLADITISPLNANYFVRQVYVESLFSSGNFQVNTGAAGGNATFKWESSLEDRSLT